MIHIPLWLEKRPIYSGDVFEIRQIFQEINTHLMSEITSKILEEYYHRFPGKPFYKLIRILGFYGIQFTGKLAPYSGVSEDSPIVLNISKQYWEEPCVIPNSPLSSYFESLGIQQLGQLHGVPTTSLKQIAHQEISAEIASTWFHATLVSAHEDLFEDTIMSGTHNVLNGVVTDPDSAYHPVDEILLRPVGTLNLSVRSSNCLREAKIDTIGTLIQKTDQELLDLKNFGRNCLWEIIEKLSELSLQLSTKNLRSDFMAIKIDFTSEEALLKLNTQIADVKLSVRNRNCLAEYDVSYIWELILLNVDELKQVKNMGRKSIDELKEIVEGMGFHLGMLLTPDQIKTIQAYQQNKPEFSGEWFVEIAQNLVSDPLDFLNDLQKAIVRERTWNCEQKQTLESIAQETNVTRERIRQIENHALMSIKQRFRKELREATADIRQQIERLGGIANLEDLNFPIELSKQEQSIVNSLLSLQDEQIYIDWKYRLIEYNAGIVTLCLDIKKQLQKNIFKDRFFSSQELEQAVRQVIEQHQIFQNGHIENLIKRFIDEEKISNLEGRFRFGSITKQDKMIVAFKELFPQGLEIYKQRELLLKKFIEFDPDTFQNMNVRAIERRLIAHSDMLLWGKGFIIHREHVSFDSNLVRQIASWIRQRFEKGHSRFRVYLPFNQFETQLQQNGIPNPYALYTVLRLIKDERIGQRKYPTMVDLDADIELKESVGEELENYLLEKNGTVPHMALKNEFLTNRGWREYHLSTIIHFSEMIFPWKGGSYIHRDYLQINEDNLQKLIEMLYQKLQNINGAYSLKGAQSEMGVLWEQVCPSATIRTMVKLIRSLDPEGLTIDHDLIYLSGSSEFVSASAEIEDFILESKTEVYSHVLQEEFRQNRGWSENQLYGALRKARLFKSGKTSYIHPFTLQWNAELALSVSQILQEFLQERNTQGQPQMPIGEVIDEFVLPELPNNIQWTRELLKSIGGEIEEFIFFDDAYIAIDNDYQIEDLDEMIAFLIAKHWKLGIAKKEQVERLLWREGIQESGKSIPFNLFFEGASIAYLESSDEVQLSEIGKKQYGNGR